MVDLHTHSTASDGTFTPTELAFLAKEAGLTAWALTDHDTMSGIEEAKKAADLLGIEFINGVELSIRWSPGEFHLLGLGVSPDSSGLRNLLHKMKKGRINRSRQMAEKLNKAGISIDFDRLMAVTKHSSIGRPHFARYLVQEKQVKTIQEAFDKYFAKGRPFFIEKECIDFDEAIHAIKDAKGVPVLAHPMSLYLSWAKLPTVIQDLKERGLMGLEAWHPSARYAECARLDKLAKKFGLIITAGSDFHGTNRSDRFLGKTVKDMPIVESFYTENLLPAIRQAHNQ